MEFIFSFKKLYVSNYISYLYLSLFISIFFLYTNSDITPVVVINNMVMWTEIGTVVKKVSVDLLLFNLNYFYFFFFR